MGVLAVLGVFGGFRGGRWSRTSPFPSTYINHSSTPNCEYVSEADGTIRLSVYPISRIEPGAELTADYGSGFDYDGHGIRHSHSSRTQPLYHGS